MSEQQGMVPTAPVVAPLRFTPHHTALEMLREETLGEYEIQAELGRGGMATVYLAHDLALSRPVAIKVMSPALVEEGVAERFRREARTAASLNHPHIIPIYAVRERTNLLYFVMKFIGGPSLDPILKDRGPLAIPMVHLILSQAANALGYAHRRGVIHRDIKPANIMLDEDGWVVVTDFGIAKVSTATGLTMTGVTVGTPAYMSPEQCMGREVTGASDQYSLGVVAYQLLTGQRPFNATTAMSMMYAHFNDTPRPLRELRPDCPAELDDAVLRMLAKDPRDRWPSIDEAFGGVHLTIDDATRQSLAVLVSSSGHATLAASISVPTSPVPPARRSKATVEVTPPRTPVGFPAAAAAPRDTPVSFPGDAAADRTPPGRDTVPTPAVFGTPRRNWLLAGLTTIGLVTVVLLARRPAATGIRDPADSSSTVTADTSVPQVPGPVADSVAPRTVPRPESPVAAAVARVVPIPARLTLEAGKTARVALELWDKDDSRISDQRPALWTSAAPGVASVDQTGTIRSIAAGSATIRATVEGITGQLRVDVTAPTRPAPGPEPVASVVVTPATVTLQEGDSVTLQATPQRAGGGPLAGRPVSWSSGGPAVQVSPAGLVTALQSGVAVVRAEAEGQIGTSVITVNPMPVAEVSLSPPGAVIVAGRTVQLNAVARDARGTTLEDRRVSWATSDSSTATVSAGLVSAVRAGSARITAAIGGRSAIVQITVLPTAADQAAERTRAVQEIDRILGAFATALNQRNMDQLKASYPGMTSAENGRWQRMLESKALVHLVATVDRASEPKVDGDQAECQFKLLLQQTYSGQPVSNNAVNYRALFQREGARWQLVKLQQQ